VIKEVSLPVTVVGPASAVLSKGAHVKVIPVKVQSWKFTPGTIEVNKGDLVRLLFTTAQDEVELYNGHGFGIEGYNHPTNARFCR
jgi:hypothetical protein